MSGRKPRAKRITADQLDELGSTTLEDILAVVNGGRYEPFFLQRPREFKDGSREYLTRKGGKAYGALVSLLYAVARLTDRPNDMENIVETLDNIVGDP